VWWFLALGATGFVGCWGGDVLDCGWVWICESCGWFDFIVVGGFLGDWACVGFCCEVFSVAAICWWSLWGLGVFDVMGC